ncbi:sulfatase-like hydrolase/transferase [Sphingopyxis sp. MWB1]|uniref:sulfatase-like hydrolase/transferase n=1 Tax=Sphingopyxis sp. MWB1 TaxID=1537715 RepID=UPI00068D266E|nr:sulfatase-like hydrolase/transferase [Sphingopyxis sp. MWB1]
MGSGLFDQRALLKTLLLLVALGADYPAMGARIGSLGLSPSLLLYIGLYGLLAATLWVAAFIERGAVRWSVALLLAAGELLVNAIRTATADAMSYELFVTMILSAGFADDALAQHGRAILWAGLGAAALLLGIGLRPGTWRPMPRTIAMLAPLGGVALLALLLFFRGGEGARGLPSAMVGAAYSSLFVYEAATLPAAIRQSVKLGRSGKEDPRDLILIIDESIAGRYLDINDPAGVQSGLAAPPPGVHVANFGLAASITHCSFGSNLTLRHGGTRRAYQQINAVRPSIFAYAKRAGYATVYIDAQRTGGAYQNGMDDAERRHIDNFIQFDDTPVLHRDMAVADALVGALANDRREFILVNKMGAHFPVADKYPDSAHIYRPALPRGENVEVAEMQLPANLYSGADVWRSYRNAYRNSLRWTVGAFFERLLSDGRIDRGLILYTADHGQNLHERGGDGTTTHCSPAPAAEEGAVPLVLIDTHGRWQKAAQRNFDASSHYRIFPTLLTAMGYDRAAVRKIYGEGLDAPSRDANSFNALFHARLGRQPEWVAVRRAAIARPPASDHDEKSPSPAPTP